MLWHMQAFNAARSITNKGDSQLAPRPLQGHPFSAVHDCSFSIFPATLHDEGRFSTRNLRSRYTVVTGTHLPRSVHIMYYQIKFICLTVLKNVEFYVTHKMAAGLMRQKPNVIQCHFKHHLLNSMVCGTCQPFDHI
jgi:hypothetical protein